MPDDRVFNVGLTMAGAISAGAYTAGVFDFLIQALSEWEKTKTSAPESVADHRCAITAISGASAGGMTAVLGAIGPGALDEEPTKMGIPSLGYPEKLGFTTGGVLPRNQANPGREVSGRAKGTCIAYG